MTKNEIYVETSVISYFVARPNRDFVTAARQELTRTWWTTRLPDFDAVVSEVVEREIREGDAKMVKSRLDAITGFRFLSPEPTIDQVIVTVGSMRILPTKALDDLAHLAFAAVHKVPVVATWNFRHLANPDILPKLRKAFAGMNLVLPEVFTPEQLLLAR